MDLRDLLNKLGPNQPKPAMSMAAAIKLLALLSTLESESDMGGLTETMRGKVRDMPDEQRRKVVGNLSRAMEDPERMMRAVTEIRAATQLLDSLGLEEPPRLLLAALLDNYSAIFGAFICCHKIEVTTTPGDEPVTLWGVLGKPAPEPESPERPKTQESGKFALYGPVARTINTTTGGRTQLHKISVPARVHQTGEPFQHVKFSMIDEVDGPADLFVFAADEQGTILNRQPLAGSHRGRPLSWDRAAAEFLACLRDNDGRALPAVFPPVPSQPSSVGRYTAQRANPGQGSDPMTGNAVHLYKLNQKIRLADNSLDFDHVVIELWVSDRTVRMYAANEHGHKLVDLPLAGSYDLRLGEDPDMAAAITAFLNKLNRDGEARLHQPKES